MRNWKLEPKNSNVAEYIDCYWFLEKEQKDQVFEYPKLNPDPAAHIILTPADLSYKYSYGSVSMMGKGCHWLFPHCKTLVMDHAQSFMILGIKFHVGALYSLNHQPKQPIVDQVIEFNSNHLPQLKNIEETELLVAANKNPEYCRDILDVTISPWILEIHY